MSTLRQRLEACDVGVRSRLVAEERVLAVGRCEDITMRGGIDRGGAAWTYVMVTDRNLRWVPHADLRFEATLDLDDVTAAVGEVNGHRYAIGLEHRPVTRSHRVPAHRFLMFKWGDSVTTTPLSRTKLAFSRRDTDAAEALREQLILRNVLGVHS